MKLARRRTASRTLRELHVFYGGARCIIEGCHQNVDFHHLDDDPSNSTFENLIPLSRDYNTELEVYRRYESSGGIWKGVHPRLTPEALLIFSRSHFQNASAALAYGCARIATWLPKLYPKLFSSCLALEDAALQALSCARHAAAPSLVVDILCRDVIPLLRSRQSSPSKRVAFLIEMASILQEYEYFALSEDLFEVVASEMRHLAPDEKNFQQARLLRRRSLTNIAGARQLDAAEQMIDEADTLVGMSSANLHVGNVNAKAWRYMADGNSTAALDLLLPVVQHVFKDGFLLRSNLSVAWNALETALTYYGALQISERKPGAIGLRRSARERVEALARSLAKANVQLRPLALRLSVASRDGYQIPDCLKLYGEYTQPRQDEATVDLISAIKETTRHLL